VEKLLVITALPLESFEVASSIKMKEESQIMFDSTFSRAKCRMKFDSFWKSEGNLPLYLLVPDLRFCDNSCSLKALLKTVQSLILLG